MTTATLNRMLQAGALGAIVGGIWTVFLGPLTDGPPSVGLSLAMYVSGLAATGLLVGAVRGLPVLVGLNAVLILGLLAPIVGPWDTWIVIWIAAFGGSGLVCGPIVGALYYWLVDLASNDERSADDAGLCEDVQAKR